MRGRSKATLIIEAAIQDIVEERKPITVRGVCYALFVGGISTAWRPRTRRRSPE